MDLPGIGSVKGDWDLRGRFDEYVGGVDLRGKTVLDVGTASGFLSFEAEKRGALVTSFDADTHERIQTMPPDALDPIYFNGMRNSYRLAHRAFGSRATTVYGDLYSLSNLLGGFDVVIVAQILVHLRDPFGALHQAALACKDTLIIAEATFAEAGDYPFALYCGTMVPHSWWWLSLPIYRHVLKCYGFRVLSESTAKYKSEALAAPPFAFIRVSWRL
jgi:hypothetical protein